MLGPALNVRIHFSVCSAFLLNAKELLRSWFLPLVQNGTCSKNVGFNKKDAARLCIPQLLQTYRPQVIADEFAFP